MKMPYYDSENKTITTVANGSCNWTYRANGLYDTLLTGPVSSVGHQPMAFDQMAIIYKNYTVKACKLSIELLAGSTTTASGAMQIFVYPNPESTTLWATLANANALRETDKVRYKIIPTAYTMNRKERMIKYYATTRSVLGVNDTNDPDLQGNSAADPNAPWYWNVSILCLDESTAITTTYIGKLVFYVEWSNPKPLAAS